VLFWRVCLFAQTTSSSEQNPGHSVNPAELSEQPVSPEKAGSPTARFSGLEVLTDTQGVDFGPYLRIVLRDIKQNWYSVIPETAGPPLYKRGKVSIEFAITKGGQLAGLHYVSGSGDVVLDRAAYGGITASDPLPPLPAEFRGRYLRLRMSFVYNPSLTGISPSHVQVNAGSSQLFSPLLTRVNDETQFRISWSVFGRDCAGSACGTISDVGLYTAPLTVPGDPTVIVTAKAEDDLDETVSAPVTIVPPPSR